MQCHSAVNEYEILLFEKKLNDNNIRCWMSHDKEEMSVKKSHCLSCLLFLCKGYVDMSLLCQKEEQNLSTVDLHLCHRQYELRCIIVSGNYISLIVIHPWQKISFN